MIGIYIASILVLIGILFFMNFFLNIGKELVQKRIAKEIKIIPFIIRISIIVWILIVLVWCGRYIIYDIIFM